MSKKIILYGLAFGSVSGAALFVYYSKQLYLSDSLMASLFSFFAFMLATALGVILCVISLNRDSEKQATLPQLILFGLITGTVICLVTSVVHAYVLAAHTAWIDNFVEARELSLRKMYSTSDFSAEDIQKQIDGFKSGFYSKFKFFVSQFSVGASLSLLSSAITGYILVKRRK